MAIFETVSRASSPACKVIVTGCNLALAPLILINYSVQFYFLVRDMHCCGYVLTMTTPINIASGCNMNTIADIGVSRRVRNSEVTVSQRQNLYSPDAV